MFGLIDAFLRWLRPLVLLPPRCHMTWRTGDALVEMHACRLVAGHSAGCSCFCGEPAQPRVLAVMDERD